METKTLEAVGECVFQLWEKNGFPIVLCPLRLGVFVQLCGGWWLRVYELIDICVHFLNWTTWV